MSDLVPVSSFGPYGTSDDTATWQAALASGEALWVPAGITSNVSTLLLPNNCYIKGARNKSIVKSTGTDLPLVQLSSPYNTCVTMHDVTLLGYTASGVTPTQQHGVYFINAFNSFSNFKANSPIGAGIPYHSLRLIIANFANDGVYLEGEGGSEYSFIISACSGVGIHVNSFDNHFLNCDVGGSGLQGWLFEPNGGCNTVTGGKTWFSGSKLVAGQTANLTVRSGGVVFSGHYLQDPYGSQIEVVTDPGQSFKGASYAGSQFNFTGQMGRQAVLSWFDPGVTADVKLVGAGYNAIIAQVLSSNNVRLPTYLLQNVGIPSASVAPGQNSQIQLQPLGYAISEWYQGQVNGALDGNLIDIAPFSRSRRWISNDAGLATFSLGFNGTDVGTTIYGGNSANPGLLQIQSANAGSLQGFTNQSTFPTAILTATANFANAETVTIGTTVYTFTTSALTPTSPANKVMVGASQAASLANLHHAINASGGTPGTDYSLTTVANSTVTATDNGSNNVTVTGRLNGPWQNGIATTTTAAHASWGGSSLSGGTTGPKTWTDALDWLPSGRVNRPYLASTTAYTNDAAAAAAGIPVSGEYRTATNPSDVAIRIT